jgi:hypothetical protein
MKSREGPSLEDGRRETMTSTKARVRSSAMGQCRGGETVWFLGLGAAMEHRQWMKELDGGVRTADGGAR